MTTITRILSTLTTILGIPLLWHAIMPASVCWMTDMQIGLSFMAFIGIASGYAACWLSLNNKI